jgi:cell division protein FtsI (penicillin-binding protein 3)
MLRIDGLIVKKELGRCYPAGRAAAHLVGFAGLDGAGLAGAELAFDGILRARSGRKTVMRDGKAGAVSLPAEEGDASPLSEDGGDVLLALDLTIQAFVDEALSRACEEWTPEAAAALVLDPRNGDVLAMASLPGLDAADFPREGKSVRRNRVVADVYEPGSTMKPLVAAAALDRGTVSFQQSFDCTADGSWEVPRVRADGTSRRGRRVIHDHERMGRLCFADVVVHSSNIGMAQVGLSLGIDLLHRHIRALGFGESTRCGLPGEEGGIVTRRSLWTETYTVTSVSMGHEISATPLQFAAAFATLANGGVLYRPRIALRAGDREVPPLPLRQVFDEKVVRGLMTPILIRVVTEGTGKRAQIPGYQVAGKTGTTQVLGGGGATVGYVSSFVAFAPAKDPCFLAMVLLSRPRRDRGTPYGGTVAAPAVREILERCLGYAEVPPRDGWDGRQVRSSQGTLFRSEADGGAPDGAPPAGTGGTGRAGRRAPMNLTKGDRGASDFDQHLRDVSTSAESAGGLAHDPR